MLYVHVSESVYSFDNLKITVCLSESLLIFFESRLCQAYTNIFDLKICEHFLMYVIHNKHNVNILLRHRLCVWSVKGQSTLTMPIQYTTFSVWYKMFLKRSLPEVTA